MPPSELDARLLAAHAEDDSPALINLYIEAADTAATEEATGFYLTHAYVFALEAGDARAADIKARLVEMKRDT
ncbi:hypothetical protein [uncultured Litoreibacter sp.]|uniref:hypothetical protein n=1 Tax=uncultured Litoreibacter sp. TaxID=1392394 RepID=UPI002612775E|nr:hypothetical protein [uncultured Litoreibacter sp.]